MAKQVMLAVAGAGKTYSICNGLNPENKNLIIAYTHENIHNINKELIEKFGKVPELTNVMTYHSFLYRYYHFSRSQQIPIIIHTENIDL